MQQDVTKFLLSILLRVNIPGSQCEQSQDWSGSLIITEDVIHRLTSTWKNKGRDLWKTEQCRHCPTEHSCYCHGRFHFLHSQTRSFQFYASRFALKWKTESWMWLSGENVWKRVERRLIQTRKDRQVWKAYLSSDE